MAQANQRNVSTLWCTFSHWPLRPMTKCYPMKRLTSDRPVIRQHSCSTTPSGSAIWTSLISSKTRRGAISLGLGTQVYPLSWSRLNTWVQNTKHKAGRTGRGVQVHLRDLYHQLSVCKSTVGLLSIRTVKLSLPKTKQTTAFATKHATTKKKKLMILTTALLW